MARAGPKMKASLQKLVSERDRLLAQIESLKSEVKGMERAIQLLEHEEVAEQVSARTTKRGDAKTVLLDLLREVGTTGLNASTAVAMAERRGSKLERGTAASNLSRMKADGVVIHDGEKYRLPEFRPTMTVVQGGAKVS